MYKVLIVDDELLIISSLKKRINWNEYGFEIVGEANNGIEAYEKILQLSPDIVFTDIRMPGMSGLELLQKVKDISQNIYFIIISGYAEFEYAQKAVNYGAFGFCLKPFDKNEIGEILKKTKIKFDNMKAFYENEFIAIMENTSTECQKQKLSILRKLGFEFDNKNGIRVMVSAGDAEPAFSEKVSYVKLKIGRARYAYLFVNNTEVQDNNQYIMYTPQEVKGVGISRTYYSVDAISTAIDEASIAASQFFMTGISKIYEYDDNCSKNFERAVKDLRYALITKNTGAIEKSLNLVRDIFKGNECNVKHALKVYNLFLYIYNRDSLDNYENSLETYEQMINLFPNVQDMLSHLEALSRKSEGNDAYLSEESENDTYNKVLKYINLNYCKDISLQSIADIFYVNPNYISQLFKRVKGETFIEYLTNLRIKQACIMLRTTDRAVYEVADSVGYNEYFYFARVFKRATGKTPMAYRDCKDDN